MRISDWSSDVCSSDLQARRHGAQRLSLGQPGGVAHKPCCLASLPAQYRHIGDDGVGAGCGKRGVGIVCHGGVLFTCLTGLSQYFECVVWQAAWFQREPGCLATAMRKRSEEKTYELQSLM